MNASGRLSAKTKWVIAAHEVGHLIGGSHAHASASSCSFFANAVPICGTSIMAAGGGSSLINRAEYFTDANDRRFYAVLNAAL